MAKQSPLMAFMRGRAAPVNTPRLMMASKSKIFDQLGLVIKS